KIFFPQFYEIELSDEEIAKEIKISKFPETEEGKILMEKIKSVAIEKEKEKTPCKFLIYDGNFLGENLKIYIAKYEENKFLLGPACLNDIYVYNHEILGVPKDDKFGLREVKEKGKFVFSYIDAISAKFAKEIEEFVNEYKKNKKENKKFFEIKDAKSSNDINIEIPEYVREYINSKQKRIIIKGPIFIGIEVEIC
ncbi:MAG: hypothetical protein ACK4YO_01330, partial [Candidatus Altarchaeaceae archaeon]